MKDAIPIQNLYYLLLYAWNALEQIEDAEVAAADHTKLVDLFAHVLQASIDQILRRGLDRGYLGFEEPLSGLRGKIDLSASVKAATIWRGKLVCDFDELSHDVLHNRVIKSTVKRLLMVPDLDAAVRDRLYDTFQRLHQITEIEVNDTAFRSLQLHRNNRAYRIPIAICRIIHQAQLVQEDLGDASFREFFRDERKMRVLFERFVRRFYCIEQHRFRVRRNRLEWARTEGHAEHMKWLPGMRTDIQLSSRDRLILIETKFVPRIFQSYFGKTTLRSGHLYQVFCYLQHLASHAGGRRNVEAILLYPTVDAPCDLQYRMFGHILRVFALDLNLPWRQIHSTLLGLLTATANPVALP